MRASQTIAASAAWAPYEPTDEAPWNLQRGVHLHRRAGFAANWDQLQRDLADGPQAAVDRMLAGDSVGDASSGFEEMARTIGDAATASGNSGRLKARWLYRMLMSPDPLGERLTLMWHNHFATSNRKVRDLVRMRAHTDTLRAHCRAPFGELLSAVVKQPAMLVWLDDDSNRGGHANENLARSPVALWGRRSAATALAATDDLTFSTKPPSGVPPPVPRSGDWPLEQFVLGQFLAAYAAADQFEQQQHRAANRRGKDYPDSRLAAQLNLVARMITSNSSARVYYTIQGGYDTHSSQLYTHAELLHDLSEALKAFVDDLGASQVDDRVIVLAFSEFGRRVAENDSQGTDHGTAGPVLLAGTPIRGGLLGNAPDLSNLVGGDLTMQFDFRQLYAALLDDWLAVDPVAVLGEAFEKPPIISA